MVSRLPPGSLLRAAMVALVALGPFAALGEIRPPGSQGRGRILAHPEEIATVGAPPRSTEGDHLRRGDGPGSGAGPCAGSPSAILRAPLRTPLDGGAVAAGVDLTRGAPSTFDTGPRLARAPPRPSLGHFA